MSNTNIEWCKRPGTLPKVWNPTTGCDKVSQGCKNCYAERMHKRMQKMLPEKYSKDFNAGAVEHPDLLTLPLKWKKPCTVFVNSMSDLFHEDVSWNFIYKVFEMMAHCPQHTFIILTKRANRMAHILPNIYFHLKRNGMPAAPLPNVWLGVSVEDQEMANERIPLLLQCPAAVRVLSVEPMLGPVSLRWAKWHDYENKFKIENHSGKSVRVRSEYDGIEGIHQVFCGGESGPDARPMHPEWVRQLQQQCAAAGVAFFFKQWGEWAPYAVGGRGTKEFNWVERGFLFQWMCKVGKHTAGRLLDGVEYNEFANTVSKDTASLCAKQFDKTLQSFEKMDGFIKQLIDKP